MGRVTTSCESFAPLQLEITDELTYAVEEGAARGKTARVPGVSVGLGQPDTSTLLAAGQGAHAPPLL